MTLPGQTAGVSVFFDPITADLGISRTSASIAYAVGTLAGILPAPVIGRWIDRRGPRLTATIIASGLRFHGDSSIRNDAAHRLRAVAWRCDRRP
jgi:MFS family permease